MPTQATTKPSASHASTASRGPGSREALGSATRPTGCSRARLVAARVCTICAFFLRAATVRERLVVTPVPPLAHASGRDLRGPGLLLRGHLGGERVGALLHLLGSDILLVSRKRPRMPVGIGEFAEAVAPEHVLRL